MTPKEALKELRKYESVPCFIEYMEIIESALNQLEEYQKCIDLKVAKYISTHNMSVMDTETYDLLHERSKRLEKLDEEGVKNEDIRDAYICSCRANAHCDYKSRVMDAKLKTVFPNLYLMLYSWFNKPEQYRTTKKEILEKQANLKAKLIGIKKEEWIQNDRIESEEINEEIINEVLEEI